MTSPRPNRVRQWSRSKLRPVSAVEVPSDDGPSTPTMAISTLPECPKQWDLNKQATTVPGSGQPGYTPIYRNAGVPELDAKETIYDLFDSGLRVSADRPCLGQRPWDEKAGDFARRFEWLTYAQVDELRTAVGSGLTRLQQEGKLGQGVADTHWMMGIWCQNRPESQIIDLGAVSYSRTIVSLYDSYDQATALFVLAHSESRVCFTTASHLAALLSRSEEVPLLKCIVLLDSIPRRSGEETLARQWAETRGIHLVSYADLLELGRKHPFKHNPPTSNFDVTTYCYTSGTTGTPKAAMVTHRQIATAAIVFAYFVTGDPRDERTLSYLPLSHMYERTVEAAYLRMGASIGYFSGDVLRLIEDAQILGPTLFAGVPRVFNRIAGMIQAQADGPGLKGKLLRTAIAAKVANHDQSGTVHHAFYDRVVFAKVRAVLGGRVTLMLSGSAPIRAETIKLLRVCFSCDIREGYAQTENASQCLIMLPHDTVLGTCGPPFIGVEVRLKDCPELGYTSQDKPHPRGEILSRGPAVFPGYAKDPAKTRETIDDDGWLHSGDVGSVDDTGRFRIIDRVKNLVKLSQGEYVAIENVEQKLAHKIMAQFWLYGDAREAHLVAVGVPDPDAFAPYVSSVLGKQVSPTDLAALDGACRDPKIVSAVVKDIHDTGRAASLRGFEIPKAVKLRMEPFSIENGLLTPTFKVKRAEAAKILADDIAELYRASSNL